MAQEEATDARDREYCERLVRLQHSRWKTLLRVLRGVSGELGLLPLRDFSFPFPRVFGRVFAYNEFVCVSRRP